MNNTYVVQPGDTLYGISRQHNMSAQRIRELNNLENDIIYPSQVLIISENSDSNPSECVTYIVKKGDSLYSIAKKYDSTADAIKRYNNLTSNLLSIGQKLKIPCYMDDSDGNSSDISKYASYTVEKGDNLYGIAKKFGTTVDKIKKDNNMDSNTLTIGQTLLIEDNTGISSIEECYGEDFSAAEDYTNYTVKSGDNLYSIAKKFGTTVSKIKSLNNLTSNNLSLNQVLKIPTNTITYTVKKGDSLYSIAKQFGTTADAIKQKNNLKSNLLSIGQELLI